MGVSTTRQLFGRTVLITLLAGGSSCGPPPARIPLAVPLPPVGGSRPATPQGLELIAEFGDGVWGQEQTRVETAGVGFGFALRDRIEFRISSYVPTRRVQRQTGETTTGIRGKVRLGDFYGGRASVGVSVAYMSSQRDRGNVQDERMTALDVALPVAYYPWGGQFIDRRWSVYAAPRLVFQTFEDRLVSETTKGTLAAALLGVAARWQYFALTGELNFARTTPTLSFGGTTVQSGWLLLPMASVSAMLPIGD